MRKLTFLLVATCSFCQGCAPASDYRTSTLISPSKKFHIFATVNRSNPKKNDYASVVVHLLDNAGKELYACKTNAGDANKWALGWMPSSDIVILQSSDVGDMAFAIKNNKLIEIIPPTVEMLKRAKQLKK